MESFKIQATFPVPPETIYNAWLGSQQYSEYFTKEK